MSNSDQGRYNLEKLAVLVIDDSQFMRYLIESILRALRVGNVLQSADAAEGFTKLGHNAIDLILVDWVMEPLDGLDFTRLIRTGSDSPNPYIGLCPVPRGRSGLADQQCRRAGPAWYRARQEGLAVRRLRPWRSQSRVHVHPDRHGENERRRSSGLARRRARSHRRPFVPAPRRAPPLELEAGPGRRHTSRITHVPRCCPTSRAKSKLTAVLAGWVPIKESSGSFGKRAARGLRLIILPDFSCQL